MTPPPSRRSIGGGDLLRLPILISCETPMTQLSSKQLLEARANPFGGMVIAPGELPSEAVEFAGRLQASLAQWTAEGIKAAWLEVPIANSALIPEAVNQGFTFHHSAEEYLMLTAILQEGAWVPHYATHYIGIGGVVLTPERELLVVREIYGVAGRPPTLKLPGGALHPNENLAEAVEREVLEETGVQAEFEAIACFRHWHGYRYGKSDIYFVSRLRPLSREITMQADEIQECLWLPVDDFLSREDISNFNKQIVRAALESEGVVQSFIPGFGGPDTREYFMPAHLVDGEGVWKYPGRDAQVDVQ